MSYDVPLRVAIGGNVDSGKCLKKDTPILMFNGDIKMIQDIKIGELVMGDDSCSRQVIDTVIGRDIMYNIKMEKGGDYTVNSHHILCLKQNSFKDIYKYNKSYICKWWENLNIKEKRFECKENALHFLKNIHNLSEYTIPKIIDINVKDYINLPDNIKKELYGYKVSVYFPYKEVYIDPYLLGEWLGLEKEITSDINKIYIEKDSKYIPNEYKYNCQSIHLKLLAGFIDSRICSNYFIIQHPKLIKDLEFICRCLGFWTNIKDDSLYINGPFHKIPTKKVKFKIIKKDYLISNIKVNILEEDEYYGISLNGNQRFLLGNFIVTHNSSVLGYLKTGIPDDGNGLSRSTIFNYPHEHITGRTSSISQKTLMINNKKIIFYDLAGHEKYFKTTLYGISSSYPDIMLILIESNKGVQQMTKEHIISSIYLRIPIVIVMTKLDIAIPNKLNNNIKIVKRIMKSVGKHIYEINEENDIDTAIKTISETLVPLLKISSVKGNDIHPPFRYLPDFLNKLNINSITESKEDILFVIDKSFRTEGYPLIASGYMRFGKINVNDKLLIGPINNEYIEITIRSIHDDDKNNISFLRKNESGCVSIKSKNNILKHKNEIQPGMIITNKQYPFVKKFIGSVTIFSHHSTTIKIGYNTIIHCGAIRKTVNIFKIEDENGKELECLRGGDKNIKIYFEFLNGKYFISKNDRFIFREGKTRGSGNIISIIE
jgi:elongation factor 1-alpha